MPPPPRLSSTDVACWLIKSRLPLEDLSPGWDPGTERTLTRCVRGSYRTTLMATGQPCVLWLSGARDPGVHAIGHLAGPAGPGDAEPGTRSAEVEVTLRRLVRPVPRAVLLDEPAWAAVEVLRMPAGSNPSYLGRPSWTELLDHLEPDDREAAGRSWVR